MHPRLMRALEFLIFLFKPESSSLDPKIGHNALYQQTFIDDASSVAGIIKAIVWVILAIVAALGIGLL